MSNKLVVILLFLVFIGTKSRAQVSTAETKKLIDFLANRLTFDRFKDSTAIYSCYVKFEIDKKNPSAFEIQSSDSTVSEQIKGLHLLNEFNFTHFMGNSKSAVFCLPIVIIVFSSSQGKQSIALEVVADKVRRLFYVEDHPRKGGRPPIYLFPHIATLDKKIYD